MTKFSERTVKLSTVLGVVGVVVAIAALLVAIAISVGAFEAEPPDAVRSDGRTYVVIPLPEEYRRGGLGDLDDQEADDLCKNLQAAYTKNEARSRSGGPYAYWIDLDRSGDFACPLS